MPWRAPRAHLDTAAMDFSLSHSMGEGRGEGSQHIGGSGFAAQRPPLPGPLLQRWRGRSWPSTGGSAMKCPGFAPGRISPLKEAPPTPTAGGVLRGWRPPPGFTNSCEPAAAKPVEKIENQTHCQPNNKTPPCSSGLFLHQISASQYGTERNPGSKRRPEWPRLGWICSP